MEIYVHTNDENYRRLKVLTAVDVRMKDDHAYTLPDLMEVAALLWPNTDIKRIWLSLSRGGDGICMRNMDVPQVLRGVWLNGYSEEKEKT